MTPTVSVLMPVYNTKRYLRWAVESVLSQTFCDFELLALNDGSTDNSLSILRELKSRDSRIHVISRENQGIVRTRNELIALARGRYLALLDSDDISKRERFEKQVAYLDAHAECVAVGSRSLIIDSTGMPIMESKNELTHEKIESAHFSGVCESQFCNSSVMMRRETVLHVGGYREGLKLAEDFDLYLRLAEVGKLANLPEVLVEYRHHLRSVCYTDGDQLRKDAQRAVREALIRRGKDIYEMPGRSSEVETASSVHRKWAWWALSAGNVATARKHAIAALARRPFNKENLKVVACCIRGY